MKYKNLLLALFFFTFINIESYDKSKKIMKILFVVDVFPAPTQTFILNQIKGLIDLGHDITILASRKDPYNVPQGIVSSDVHEYNLLSKVKYIDLYQELDFLFVNLLKNIPNINSFDILFCQFGHLGEIFANLKTKYFLSGKLVTSFRGADASFLESGKQNYKKLFQAGDLFLPVCKYFKNILIAAGCNKQKIKVQHSAIDCTKFVFKIRKKKFNENMKIVTIGRIVREKGLEYSVRAITRLIKKYPKIKYLIVGSGPFERGLQKLIVSLGVTKSIQMIGFKEHNEVARILSETDIFILTPITTKKSILEGIPNVLMEALACGIPVVSTYHSGIPELVRNGVSGFLVPEKSVDELQNRIEYLINHGEIWSILGSAGRRQVELEHNIKTENVKLEFLLLQLL